MSSVLSKRSWSLNVTWFVLFYFLVCLIRVNEDIYRIRMNEVGSFENLTLLKYVVAKHVKT